jgi:predicted nucleic acid-binding protein
VTFFDTNVLVYAAIDQDLDKLAISTQKISEALADGILCLSPLVLSEYIFVLSKLNIIEEHQEEITLYAKYVRGSLERYSILSAYEWCRTYSVCKNINDILHLKTAEGHCDKLVTFDRDFKQFIPHTSLEIEILN